MAGKLQPMAALDKGTEPLKDFMIRQTRERDLMLMIDVAHAQRPATISDISLVHLVPAFMLTELRSAFQIGFVIFLPFLLIDLVVSSDADGARHDDGASDDDLDPDEVAAVRADRRLQDIVIKALLGTFH